MIALQYIRAFLAARARLAVGALLLGLWTPGGSAQLVVPGSGAPEFLVRELARAFNETANKELVKVPPSIGTGRGIRAVEKGEAVIARVGRPLTAAEAAQGLKFIALGTDAVVFAVGADVPVKSLSHEQLAGIFSGTIDNWSALGAQSARIRVVTREATDTNLSVIRNHLAVFRNLTFTDKAKMVTRDPDMLEMLENFPTAIGFLTQVSLHGAKRPVRAVGINGEPPTPEDVAANRYPLVQEYGFVHKSTPKAEAKAFLDFVASSRGRMIISKYGVVPAAHK